MNKNDSKAFFAWLKENGFTNIKAGEAGIYVRKWREATGN